MNSGFLSSSEADKFRQIIDTYKPSDEAIDVFAKSNFAVIAGPVVSGKDTLRQGLLSSYPKSYQKVLSLTSRLPRPDEKDTYEFINTEEMMKRANNKQLLQLALVHDQQVSATDISVIKNIAPDKIGLSILIVQAEQGLSKLKPDMKTIFMIPPSFEDFICRIKQDRVVDEGEFQRRLVSAKKEIEVALNTERYYLLASDIQEDVRLKADEFLRHDIRDSIEEEKAKSICREILKKLG